VDATYGFELAPLDVALWAIPTAVCALVIHGARMLWLDRSLTRELGRAPAGDGTAGDQPVVESATVSARDEDVIR
jgi:hypothetical protein